MNDITRQGVTEPDTPGQMAYQGGGQVSGHDQPAKTEPRCTLDLYEVAGLFDEAGLPRNRRSLSRYCTRNKLDCQKVETLNGEEWRVDEQSVHRLIAQIHQQERQTRPDMPEHNITVSHGDQSRHVQTCHQSEMPATPTPTGAGHVQTTQDASRRELPEIQPPTGEDMPGQVPSGGETARTSDGVSKEPSKPGMEDRLLTQFERENDLLRDQLKAKDRQLEVKDQQILQLVKQGEVNAVLLQNFQRKFGMLEAPDRMRPQSPETGESQWPRSSVDN